MSILDEIDSLTPKHGPTCTVARIVEQLPKDTAAEITEIMDRRLRGPSAVHRFLERQAPIKVNAVQRHMRGECACPS